MTAQEEIDLLASRIAAIAVNNGISKTEVTARVIVELTKMTMSYTGNNQTQSCKVVDMNRGTFRKFYLKRKNISALLPMDVRLRDQLSVDESEDRAGISGNQTA